MEKEDKDIDEIIDEVTRQIRNDMQDIENVDDMEGNLPKEAPKASWPEHFSTLEEEEVPTMQKQKEKKEVRTPFGNRKSLLGILLFPLIFMYLEFSFHCLIFGMPKANIIFPLLIAAAYGCFVTALTGLFSRKVNCIVGMTVVAITSVWFSTQLVFEHIFRTFLSLYSVGENGGDVLEFWKQALEGILQKLPGILILMLPIVVAAILIKKCHLLEKQSFGYAGLNTGAGVFVHILFLVVLLLPGKEPHTPYDLYHNDFIQDLGVDKVGMLTATCKDVKNVFFGADEFTVDEEVFVAVPKPEVTVTVAPTNPVDNPHLQPSMGTATPSPTPTPIPLDTSPHVLPIDFAALGEGEKNKEMASLYKYFSTVTPTNKNEYTGMFEGYNLIYLTAEGFSPWAVDEKITPTLYKLTHTGFVFENFYNPIWWTSTSDGEYVGCTGLIPSGTNSFTKSASCDMPLCLGWQFKELGYSTRAYHDHSYKYYHRNLSHPNMGYDYKGAKGGGLDVTLTWPESDLEMMQKTIPDYIKDEHFHTYYMTVSGHMEYTFAGNSMASKNRDYVKDLPYSDECKAYIACNKELDLALEYLISELDKAGVLDHTVIALSADHYPYGLAQDKINELAGHEVDENFELYKNYFILWNSAIKEPIVVDKYCSTVDIMPTLYNLFGLEYDSRLFMGQDILSDAPALVMTSNQSFITDYVKYNSKTGDCEMLQDVELPENYLKGYISLVKNKFNASGSIIKNNFYHELLPYFNLTTYQKPDIEELKKLEN